MLSHWKATVVESTIVCKKKTVQETVLFYVRPFPPFVNESIQEILI